MRHASLAADQPLDVGSAGLRLRGLTKVYSGGQVALEGCDAQLDWGSLAVVVGPSGSGKTTLLRLLAGLERPSGGEIWAGPQRIDTWPAHRRQVGMVFQQATLYPQWTIGENLERAQPKRKKRGTEVTSSPPAREVAAKLGIEGLWSRFPDQLSGGELQRAAIARAVVRRPQLLLLDEPFDHLDPPRRWEVRAWFAELQRRLSVTTVLVTHDPLEALMLGQRLLVLDAGHLRQVGSPADVYQRPATPQVARFFGVAGMNLIPGQVKRTERRWEFSGGGLQIPLDHTPVDGSAGEVLLGVRPQHVRLSPPTGGDNQAVVARVDWLGDQRLVWLRMQAASASEAAELRVLMPADGSVQLGSAVSVELGSDRLCFFGEQSGTRPPPTGPP
jgi:ABC-type sugar transport system ATPase subunit